MTVADLKSIPLPLFQQYPQLAGSLPREILGNFPTPVEPLKELGAKLGLKSLYVKRDDITSTLYGGNKVRKLEFIFGQALQAGVKEVLTFGGAGSNHALATAIYARRLGLGCINMLVAQPNARSIGPNLLFSHRSGAELHHKDTQFQLATATIKQLIRHRIKAGRFPLMIYPGGSSDFGTVGFVNAAFELAQQIEGGESPEIDTIYLALGSTGSAVGLALGLAAAGLAIEIIPVRVAERKFAGAARFRRHFKRVNMLLHRHDPTFPLMPLPNSVANIRHEFFGGMYGLFTEAGMEAVKMMADHGDIKLEGTYTGKAFSALIADARNGALKGKNVLFWNTYNSSDFSADIKDVAYHELPKEFHRYFESDVQPLDRK